MTWLAVRKKVESAMAWLMFGFGRRGPPSVFMDSDHAYERKLALMERRLDELGAAVEVLQRDRGDEGEWHPEPAEGQQGAAQA